VLAHELVLSAGGSRVEVRNCRVRLQALQASHGAQFRELLGCARVGGQPCHQRHSVHLAALRRQPKHMDEVERQ